MLRKFTPISRLVITIIGLTVLQASAKQRPIVLESSSNDVILVQKGQIPNQTRRSMKRKLVTICLQNEATKAGAKAFDIRKTSRPRYVAARGAQVCARFVPTRHNLYFWKTNKKGKLTLSLSHPLDLADTEGTRVNLTWVRD